MQLSLVSNFDQKNILVDYVELNTLVGNRVILVGHAPTILILAPDSTVSYGLHADIEPKKISFKSAVAHITRDQVTLIITQE